MSYLYRVVTLEPDHSKPVPEKILGTGTTVTLVQKEVEYNYEAESDVDVLDFVRDVILSKEDVDLKYIHKICPILKLPKKPQTGELKT